MSTLLEMRIEELEEQNAALAAQVEALRKAIDESGAYKTNQMLSDALHATPQQHLRQVRADAGRDGYVAGADRAWHYLIGTKSPNNMTAHLANQYHASILAGKE